MIKVGAHVRVVSKGYPFEGMTGEVVRTTGQHVIVEREGVDGVVREAPFHLAEVEVVESDDVFCNAWPGDCSGRPVAGSERCEGHQGGSDA